MVEVMKIMVASFKRPHACTAALSAPTLQQGITDSCFHQGLLYTHREVWVSFLWGHCSFLLCPGVYRDVCVLHESVSPVPGKFWRLDGSVNGDLLQEGLCNNQVCCIQSPCPCAGHC